AVTRSEVLFVDRGRVRASTLPPSVSDTVLRETGPGRISRIAIGGEEYEAVWRPLTLTPREPISGAQPAVQLAPGDGDGPHVVVLRSRTAHLAFLSTLHTALGFIALLAILVATLLSYAVARTVTRPLRALTATMREMAATGNLAAARPPAESRWEDEDARLLTRTFHGLTQALVRFHREAAQRERLSSLGRLSTVLAHEIRNPLMIIKTSLRTLRRGTAGGADVSAAIADIEGEVARLNRIVHEVLDYARPITFTYGEVDLAHVVRDAAYAALAALPGPEVEVEAPERLQVTTDGERVRQALVNVLSNAREAVVAAADGEVTGASLPPVRLLLAEHGDEQVQIVVRDQGVGIAPEHLARLFEPFFTTKRAGSGIGLAIARNIVDGLGGTIAVESSAGQGTTVRLTLPRRPQDAAAAPLAAAVAGPEPAVHS
ncbi:MAG TPA: ATP-binding protein, partial [Vicinamibacterales bacterium]